MPQWGVDLLVMKYIATGEAQSKLTFFGRHFTGEAESVFFILEFRRSCKMITNYHGSNKGLGLRAFQVLVLMLLLAAPVLADLTYPVTDNFETSPTINGWTIADGANGSAGWDATESVSATHSIKLSHVGGGFDLFTTKAYVK